MQKLSTIAMLIYAGVSIAASTAVGQPGNGKAFGVGNGNGQGQSIAFALVGDTPYGASREADFDLVIDDINDTNGVQFVIHVGDIKAGGERCDDSLLVARFYQFEQFDMPFVYTPGDNEWTDCHRTSNGTYLPTERLAKIRELFFPIPGYTTGGVAMPVATQADMAGYEPFVENTLFHKAGVVFSQIHVVGSNNNLLPWDQYDPTDTFESPRPDRLQEFEQRNMASLDWLAYTFEEAEANDARGVFISIHANPRFDLDMTSDSRAGFNDFLADLSSYALKYDKPVVLAHGDSHVFFVDRPRLSWQYWLNPTPERIVPNLTRVETFGSGDNHWIKVVVDPKNDNVFSFQPQIVDANVGYAQ